MPKIEIPVGFRDKSTTIFFALFRAAVAAKLQKVLANKFAAFFRLSSHRAQIPVSGLCSDCLALLDLRSAVLTHAACGVWVQLYSRSFQTRFFEAGTPEKAGFFRSPASPRELREREILSREWAKFSVSRISGTREF